MARSEGSYNITFEFLRSISSDLTASGLFTESPSGWAAAAIDCSSGALASIRAERGDHDPAVQNHFLAAKARAVLHL